MKLKICLVVLSLATIVGVSPVLGEYGYEYELAQQAQNPVANLSLPPLFEAASRTPTLVLSYGNQRIDLLGLMDLMRQHRRHVSGRAINYQHCTGLAGEDSKKKNQELLIIGRN